MVNLHKFLYKKKMYQEPKLTFLFTFVVMKLLRFLLFPFAILYDAVTSIRNLLFDKGILVSTRFNIPVICVGNLSVGGTGKTPQIEYLINLLSDSMKVAVLSRGYRRKTNGFILVDGRHNANDVGDEPLQYFRKFSNIYIAVNENRVEGINKLLQLENPPEIVLLDDGFQHRKVKASYNILLTKFNDLFTDDFLLPTGNLRESRRGVKRANTIIVSKCPINLSKKERKEITIKIKPQKHQKIFFTTILYAKKLKGNQQITIDDLLDYKVLLVTGIANSKPLVDYFNDNNINFVHLNFPDHHHFTTLDVNQINVNFKQIVSKKIIITTEKDYVKLSKIIKDISYLEINTSFLDNKKEVFDKQLKDSF